MNDFAAKKGENEKFCSECGAVINAKAEICPKCGVRLVPFNTALGQTTPSGKNRIVAALLALLLGGLGIHKFYLGQPIMGIVYLLFCWTFVPALVGFIEGILYLIQSDAKFEAKYG